MYVEFLTCCQPCSAALYTCILSWLEIYLKYLPLISPATPRSSSHSLRALLGAPAGRAAALSHGQKRKHCERASRRRAPLSHAQCPGISDLRLVISMKILNKRLAIILMRLKALMVVQLRLWLRNNWKAEVTVHDSQKYSRTARPLLGRMSKIADAVVPC